MTLFLILLSTFMVSLLSFAGLASVSIKKNLLSKYLLYLVAISAGTLMGDAFFHLLPEAIEASDALTPFVIAMFSFCSFFVIERFLHWQHCHTADCHVHEFGYLNLLGDAVHNFIDGLIIASSFLVSWQLGVVTVIAIVLHEIPQEVSDFGVLLHAGFHRSQALLANFAVGLIAVSGGFLGYFLASSIGNAQTFLLPIAAGGFLYIAAADLMPEIKKETNMKKSLYLLLCFLAGVVFMYAMKIFGHE